MPLTEKQARRRALLDSVRYGSSHDPALYEATALPEAGAAAPPVVTLSLAQILAITYCLAPEWETDLEQLGYDVTLGLRPWQDRDGVEQPATVCAWARLPGHQKTQVVVFSPDDQPGHSAPAITPPDTPATLSIKVVYLLAAMYNLGSADDAPLQWDQQINFGIRAWRKADGSRQPPTLCCWNDALGVGMALVADCAGAADGPA